MNADARAGAEGSDPGSVAPGAAPGPPDERRGEGLIVLSWLGTAVYGAVAAVDALAPTAAVQAVLIAVCVALFVIGTVAFVAGYLLAVGRSRYELIGMGGLFFLVGSAPRRVRAHLLGSFAVEIVVALASASIGLATSAPDADNPAAFGLLTPMYGLGLAGLWAGRHGVFPARAPSSDRPGGTPHDGVTGRREGAG